MLRKSNLLLLINDPLPTLYSTISTGTSTYPGLRSVDFCHRPEEETSGTFTDVDDSRFQGREEYEL